jgi:cyclopropane fatty-acyl-phospholipid synthase-like methyltransferase
VTDRPATPAGPLSGFEALYQGRTPPWDIGRPQPAFQALADAGSIVGKVLDVGCGTGEHALMAAALGLDVVGIDLSPTAIEQARAKARTRGLPVRFEVADAVDLTSLGERFDTALDCGLFHVLGDAARVRFAASLREVMAPGGRYHMLCFSDQVPGTFGPRRISREEIRATFTSDWTVESISPATLARLEVTVPLSEVMAWHATIAAT